jgi:hypothetical protein
VIDFHISQTVNQTEFAIVGMKRMREEIEDDQDPVNLLPWLKSLLIYSFLVRMRIE